MRIRVLGASALLLATACTSGTTGHGQHDSSSSTTASPPSSTTHPSGTSRPGSSTAPPPPATTAAGVFARMSEAERVGQLLMVDCPTSGIADATVTAIQTDHVGSVILDGTNSDGSAAIAAITSALETDNPSIAKLFIATDQEGGLVQRLQGPGFSTIPSAVTQGGYATGTLRSDARGWGLELRHAGVTIDLAPVLDTVPAGFGGNPPIGDLDREYGNTPSSVAGSGLAFARGLADAGIVATVKHFPGLGRVRGNTDTSSGVTDSITTASDSYLAPFRDAVRAGVPFVMISSAIYARIDPGVPAVFSSKIVTGILRDEFGFHGVVISDDVGGAQQVANYSVGARAVDFIAAGGDIVLTVDASLASEMTHALLARAAADPAFKATVDAAALRVLRAKQARGLLG